MVMGHPTIATYTIKICRRRERSANTPVDLGQFGMDFWCWMALGHECCLGVEMEGDEADCMCLLVVEIGKGWE
jgi:hypothetical protein